MHLIVAIGFCGRYQREKENSVPVKGFPSTSRAWILLPVNATCYICVGFPVLEHGGLTGTGREL